MDTKRYQELAQKHGFSEGAVIALAEAIRRGNGTMAQFNHPELGGSGQWMPGMVMIGDMFNNALKARVQALAETLINEGLTTPGIAFTSTQMTFDRWWDAELGEPNTTGSQNDAAYAYFATKNRLAIKRGIKIYLYDTKDHVILGAMQQQTHSDSDLKFQTKSGSVSEQDLSLINVTTA